MIKLEKIMLKNINKFKPLDTFILNVGSRSAVNNQNLLLVHKILKYPIYYINNEWIFLNEKYLFIYYKTQEWKIKYYLPLIINSNIVAIGYINYKFIIYV